MTTLVQKYGGTSVETPHHLLGVARLILEQKQRGRRLIVVVSAMGRSTDELVALARHVSPRPPRREMDMLLTAGERISMALLAIALDSLGQPAISFTGSQSGIITDDHHNEARIVEIRPFRIEEELERDRVVIVAGFQGVSSRKEVTTLGRGGSDTTAVALAIRFASPWCEIYSDVHGLLTADPRIVPTARTISRVDYETAITLSHLGAGVLYRRSVILARKFQMPIRLRCSLADGAETWVGSIPEEVTRMKPQSDPQPMETDRILSIALEECCVALEIEGPGEAETILSGLERGPAASPWTWIETLPSPSGALVRAVGPEALLTEEAFRRLEEEKGRRTRVERDLAVVSVVGEGVLARPSILAEAWGCLRAAGIAPSSVRSATLSVSFVVPQEKAADAVRALHARLLENA